MSAVERNQRFTRQHPCPICGGGENMARGKGKRCSGYLSSDGRFAFCSREEHAGALGPQPTAPTTYRHLLDGDCHCGVAHGASPPHAWERKRPLTKSTFVYPDENGAPLYRVVRLDGPAGKRIWQERYEDGRYVKGRESARRVLYALPEIQGAEVVHVVEGERCADALRQLGFVATTAPEGAGKWRAEYAQALQGASTVYVWPDCDDEGRRHASQVADSLTALGVEVRVLELYRDRNDGYDVHDVLEEGRKNGSLEDLRGWVESMLPLAKNYIARPSVLDERKENSFPQTLPFAPLSTALSGVQEEPQWVWRDWIALAAITVYAGRVKVGKSTLLFALLGAIERGERFCDRETATTGVLLLSEEPASALRKKAARFGLEFDSDSAETLGPRDKKAGGLHLLRRTQTGGVAWPEVVRQAVAYCAANELGVLVIDTFDKWVGIRGDDENKTGAILEALEPLQEAIAAGLAVLIITHHRKSGGKYGEGIRGASALVGACDIVLEIERDPTDESHRRRILRGISRFEDPPEIVVELVEGRYRVLGGIEQVHRDDQDAQLCEALASIGELAVAAEVGDVLGITESTARSRLQAATRRRVVRRSGSGKKGDPYHWQVTSAEDEPEQASFEEES